MKKILYILAAAASLMVAGCSKNPDIDIDTNGGKGLTFLHFETSSDTWLITKDDKSYKHTIKVLCSNSQDKDITYNLKVASGSTGKEGVDYRMPDKSITIPAGKYEGSIDIEVLYSTTGEGFNLDIVLDADATLINPSYGDALAISVKTDKVTIDWKWLEGDWTDNVFKYYDNTTGAPYTASIIKVDETNCIIRNLWGTGTDLNGVVDFENLTITIAGYQESCPMEEYSAVLYFVAVDPSKDYDLYTDKTTPVVATMSPTGIVIDNYDYLLVGGKYDGYTFAGGLKSTFTR